MKFSRRSKYFLRGMGFGILVTVVLFSVALVFYEPKQDATETAATDDVETVTEDTTETNTENTTETTEPTETADEPKNEEKALDTTDKDSKEESSEEKTDETVEEETKTEEKSEEKTENKTSDTSSAETKTTAVGNVVTFKVTAGESSYKVAENLYRAGLIDNPSSFNTYLEQNGYDNTIHVGSFNIPEGSTYEQIANTISK